MAKEETEVAAKRVSVRITGWVERLDADAQGYARCAADVVAWLDREGWPDRIAEAIEDGAHVGAAGGDR